MILSSAALAASAAAAVADYPTHVQDNWRNLWYVEGPLLGADEGSYNSIGDALPGKGRVGVRKSPRPAMGG